LSNVDKFTKFFHCQIPEEILYTYINKILHPILTVFLHYLVKLENYTWCDYSGLFYCMWDTSEFIC